ncbi:MAG: outer membrane lipoprotein-sorting protein [Methylacidiphilales bacterium]|nr:outer membrane lipoprotein-sorting protein [Candidatus Methylacidiphilales bacterium]
MFICTTTQVFARILLLWVLWISFTPVFGEENRGEQIMKQVYAQLNKHPQMKLDIEMTLVNEQGSERHRLLTMWKKKQNENSRVLIKFYSPADIKGSSFLTISSDGNSNNEQSMFLPALKRIIKISGNDKHKSFMGSDYSNDDVGGRTIVMDSHSLESETPKQCKVVSIPKDTDSPYKKLINTIDCERMVLLSVEYYDANGLFKTLINKTIKNIEGMWMPMESEMNQHKRKSYTIMKVSNTDTTVTIDDRFFSAKGLQQ